MTPRPLPVRASLGLLAGLSTLMATAPALSQPYYGPGYGYGYGPPAYGPPPGPYSYNAPPPPGREYGRAYDDDGYPPARHPRPISARMVADRLEDMGYENVGPPRFTGTLYIVRATAPDGTRQEVTVDAIRGIILNRIAVAPPPPPAYGEPPPRRYGGRPLDTDDLYRDPDISGLRSEPPPRRQAARPAPIETTPLPQTGPGPGALPPPVDPRLDPSMQPTPRPFEGRAGREARTEPRRSAPPSETGARPFGLNPAPPSAGAAKAKKEGEERKGAKPAAPSPKPVAEARPKPEKPVRVIPGVTPLATGESRSQLDTLPKPPETPAPTGE